MREILDKIGSVMVLLVRERVSVAPIVEKRVQFWIRCKKAFKPKLISLWLRWVVKTNTRIISM